jgi:transposase
VSVSKLAQQHGINANMLFKWRRDLREGLLTKSASQSARLLPVVMQHTAVRAALPSVPVPVPVPVGSIEIVIADAVVRVTAGADAALLQLVLQSLRT